MIIFFFLEHAGELRIIILRRMEKGGLTAPHTNPHPHTHNTLKLSKVIISICTLDNPFSTKEHRCYLGFSTKFSKPKLRGYPHNPKFEVPLVSNQRQRSNITIIYSVRPTTNFSRTYLRGSLNQIATFSIGF